MKIKVLSVMAIMVGILLTIGCGGGTVESGVVGSNDGTFFTDPAEPPPEVGPTDNGGGVLSDSSGNGSGNGGGSDGGGSGGGGGGGGGGNGGGGNDGDYDGDGIPDSQDPDADGDGYLASEDDCNDMDETIHPGAPDKPDHPNYTDSNCDGIDGDIKRAYWVAPTGNDTNPGTIDQPFLTLQKGIDKAKASPEDMDVYAVGAVYMEDASLDGGVGLYGGYGPLTPTNTRKRDIDVYTVLYRCQTAPFYITEGANGRESAVEGLEFTSVHDQPAVVIVNSSPTIQYNEILGVDSDNISSAVYIVALGDSKTSEPLLRSNIIKSKDGGLKEGGMSIAVLIGASGKSARANPTFNANTIQSGNAAYSSIGIYSAAGRPAEVSFTAVKNDIEASSAGTLTSGIFLGYNLFEEANVTFTGAEIHKNRIFGGHDAFMSAGVFAMRTTDLLHLTNNFITGGKDTTFSSVGIHLENSTANIFNNTINSGSSKINTISILLEVGAAAKIDNNIFYSETGMARVGIDEDHATSTPASLRNNFFDDTLSVKYHDFNLGDIVDIAQVNAMPDIVQLGSNISGAAALRDVATHDYHLLAGSDAIDAGLPLRETKTDIDDDVRPQGQAYDIGADEFIQATDAEDDNADEMNPDEDQDGDGVDEDEDCDDWENEDGDGVDEDEDCDDCEDGFPVAD